MTLTLRVFSCQRSETAKECTAALVGTIDGNDRHRHEGKAGRNVDQRRRWLFAQVRKNAAQTRITPSRLVAIFSTR